MTPVFRVSAPATLHSLAATLVATFPLHCRASNDDIGDIALIDGSAAWARDAGEAIERGCTRIILVDPGYERPQAITDLAECAAATGAVVSLAEQFAGNPAIDAHKRVLADGFVGHQIAAQDGSDLNGQILRSLRVARALGISGIVVADQQVTPWAALIAAAGQLGDTAVMVRLQGVVSQASMPRFLVRSYAPTRLATLDLPSWNTARPARSTVVDIEGALTAPTIYDTAVRSVLRYLVQADPRATGSLAGFADDVALATTMVSSS